MSRSSAATSLGIYILDSLSPVYGLGLTRIWIAPVVAVLIFSFILASIPSAFSAESKILVASNNWDSSPESTLIVTRQEIPPIDCCLSTAPSQSTSIQPAAFSACLSEIRRVPVATSKDVVTASNLVPANELILGMIRNALADSIMLSDFSIPSCNCVNCIDDMVCWLAIALCSPAIAPASCASATRCALSRNSSSSFNRSIFSASASWLASAASRLASAARSSAENTFSSESLCSSEPVITHPLRCAWISESMPLWDGSTSSA